MAVPDGLLQRAAACRQRIAGLEETLEAERERRAALITELRDANVSWKDTAAAVGISPSYCSSILADQPGPVELVG
jgi:hypothetical protein